MAPKKHAHRLIIITVCVMVTLMVFIPASVGWAQTPVYVFVDHHVPEGTSRLALGVTHTRYSLDSWGGDPAAVEQAKTLLASTTHYQNQHIMGWGALNPNPAPGVYEWETLDSRIEMIRSMGAEPVITLCCAPDWMKGGVAGETNWDWIEVAPLPEYYADFAELARQVALRYPDVHYFQVWNEMKGFWDAEQNNWDYVAYTELYNQVYDAVKSVRPEARIGGPYLVIEGTGSFKGDWPTHAPITARQWEVLNYWLEHKHGAEFLILNRGVSDIRDRHGYTTGEMLALTHHFSEVARQIRARTDLPIWWAEYHMANTPETVPVIHATILYHMVKGGSSVALLWAPMESDARYPLYTDIRAPGGGQAFPNYHIFKAFYDHFGPGVELYHVQSSSTEVAALSSRSATLLINTYPMTTYVLINGVTYSLEPYEVRVIETP